MTDLPLGKKAHKIPFKIIKAGTPDTARLRYPFIEMPVRVRSDGEIGTLISDKYVQFNKFGDHFTHIPGKVNDDLVIWVEEGVFQLNDEPEKPANGINATLVSN
jgi:hypothetical protein